MRIQVKLNELVQVGLHDIFSMFQFKCICPSCDTQGWYKKERTNRWFIAEHGEYYDIRCTNCGFTFEICVTDNIERVYMTRYDCKFEQGEPANERQESGKN